MTRRVLLAMALGACIALTPASAGGHYKKCPMPLQECLDRMSAALKTTGWVGIEFDDSNVCNGGYRILKVIPGSPAEKAGLQPGDILYALNGVRIAAEKKDAALAAARKEWKPGQSVTYTIKREGVDREIGLTLAPMPADVMARWIGEHMMQHEPPEHAAAK